MRRGEVWLAHVGRKRRPVVVMTRDEVLDVRELVTVAEITTAARGLSVETPIDHVAAGLDRPCAVNGDGLHTVRQSTLQTHLGAIGDDELEAICSAVTRALGC